MDPLIRAAIVADDRRSLRRPQPALANPGAEPASVQRPAAPAADLAAQLRRDVERQLADGRRQLEQEREAMRKTLAEDHARALERAAERGYEDGLRRGETAARAALEDDIARVRGVLGELRQAHAQVLDAAEDTMVEIAFAAICRLAGTEAASRDTVAHAVRQACAGLRADDALTVLVHPDDLAQLVATLGHPGVQLVASPAIHAGGCMIDGATGTLDARLEIQLEQLRQALLRARAERRQGERS